MTWAQWVDQNYSCEYVGIYGIFVWGRCIYVGQSSNIQKRFKAHANHVDNVINDTPDKDCIGKRGRKYEYLSRVKQEDTQFKVLEICAIEDLNKKEQWWMEYYKQPIFNYSKKPYKRKL